MSDIKLTQTEAEILMAFVDARMNVCATARMMYRHRNSINYHLERIKRRTGLDPRGFSDLVELVEAARMILKDPETGDQAQEAQK